MRNKLFVFILGCFVLFSNNASAFNTELYTGTTISNSCVEHIGFDKGKVMLELKFGFKINLTQKIFIGNEVYYNFKETPYINLDLNTNYKSLKLIDNKYGSRFVIGFNITKNFNISALFGVGKLQYVDRMQRIKNDGASIAGLNIGYKLNQNLGLNIGYEEQVLNNVAIVHHIHGNINSGISIYQIKFGIIYSFE